MTEKLQRLYNTLIQVETKGDSTIRMATCLQYLDNIITETVKKDAEVPLPEAEVVEKQEMIQNGNL